MAGVDAGKILILDMRCNTKASFDIARQDLERARLQPGNDAWENFLMGAILGVDAIHELRKKIF